MTHDFNAADIINTVFFVLASYSAWYNLYNKRISKWGLDAFFVNFWLRLIVGKEYVKKAHKDSRLIRRSGIAMLLVAIGCLIALFTP